LAKTRTRTVTRYVPSRRRSSGRSSSFKVPLAVIAGLVPGISFALGAPDNTQKMDRLVASYTGFFPSSGTFNRNMLSYGLYPLLFGFAAHAMATAFGVNRFVSKMRLPVEI
jgi:hypothetical protein